MNEKLRQIVQRLERQGYRFSFDDDTPDEVVETTLDIVFSDYEDDSNDLGNACARPSASAPARDDETGDETEDGDARREDLFENCVTPIGPLLRARNAERE